MDRTADDLTRAAIASGAQLVSTHLVQLRDGSFTLAGEFVFDDPWAAARLLQVLAEQDKDDPQVRAWARAILEGVANEAGTVPSDPRIRDRFLEAVHHNVQTQIAFMPEEGEQFQSARATMIEGVGDCDCHARLVHALVRSQGMGSSLRFFESGDEPVHVVAALDTSTGPAWAETTIAAMFGEHPQRAYKRLGLDSRPDIGGGVGAALGFLGLEFVTPGNVSDRKHELDAAVQSLDADVGRCTALDQGTRDAWNEFRAAWKTFLADEPGWLDSGAQGRQTADYAAAVAEWQTKLAPLCGSSAPALPPPPVDPAASIIKTVAIVVGVVAGAVATVKVAEAVTSATRRTRAA